MKISLKFILFISLLVGIHACSTSPKIEPGISLELAQFRKANISDITYELYFIIPEEQTEAIEGKATILFTLNNGRHDIQLDFRESEELLHSISINGETVQLRFENEHIILPVEYLSEGRNSVDIVFTAGDSSLNRNPEYLYTLFVPDRARTAFPLFDQPDLKAIFDLTLEIPKNWEAISNGLLIHMEESETTKTLNFAPSDLISSYLFSFVAGNFEKVTQNVDGVEMTMLHRETDKKKAERNIDDIFRLHKSSLDWLEEYTGIDYPFQKFDFALIPAFQYGGMEHVGAIQYRASSLFLDEDPSDSQLLSRASLIAHETAHMWFGDLVTMEWFNDVWTKEVFANFMAAKIMNPNFPEIDHDLNFVLRHHPSSYSVDRTEGANPIRQFLGNLNEAGQMYGAIIYNKAPIMMRQLELLVGEEIFREGIRDYLNTYSFGNATWPDLIDILDKLSDQDLKFWSEVWVNTPGRPHFSLDNDSKEEAQIIQSDPEGIKRVWPQEFTVISKSESQLVEHSVLSDESVTTITFDNPTHIFFNANGYGYGLFPSSLGNLELWDELEDVTKGSELINLYENMLEQKEVVPEVYLAKLLELVQTEENQLLTGQILGQIRTIYWNYINEAKRNELASDIEQILWDQLIAQDEPSRKKSLFNTYRNIALSESEVQKVYDIWRGELTVEGLNLSETDFISMSGDLSIKMPDKAGEIIATQFDNIENSDRKRRFEFIMHALSGNQGERDDFFESLKEEKNRQTESWVLSALGYLHHPLRLDESEKYILPSLELLQEIQITGDIFFPARWMAVTMDNYSSDSAVQTVRDFLEERPDYNEQLRMKILQSADGMFRANRIKR